MYPASVCALKSPVENFYRVVHNQPAPDSPLGEVVAWGEDTWP